ncbi:8225_t:CDS:2, partial [Gigaspora margarita]
MQYITKDEIISKDPHPHFDRADSEDHSVLYVTKDYNKYAIHHKQQFDFTDPKCKTKDDETDNNDKSSTKNFNNPKIMTAIEEERSSGNLNSDKLIADFKESFNTSNPYAIDRIVTAFGKSFLADLLFPEAYKKLAEKNVCADEYSCCKIMRIFHKESREKFNNTEFDIEFNIEITEEKAKSIIKNKNDIIEFSNIINKLNLSSDNEKIIIINHRDDFFDEEHIDPKKQILPHAKAWVYEKSVNKIKYRKRFYGKKNNKNLFEQALNYKLDFEKKWLNKNKLQLSNDNKALIKYQKMKNKINESLDPNKYVKDLAVKYSKYDFKLELYLEKPELLVPISKLEIYFHKLADLIKDKKEVKISKPVYNNVIKQNNNKLPKFIKIKYKKALKSTVLGDEELNILIKNLELHRTIELKILDILYYCTKLRMKETNRIVVQYKKMICDIRNSKNKNSFYVLQENPSILKFDQLKTDIL